MKLNIKGLSVVFFTVMWLSNSDIFAFSNNFSLLILKINGELQKYDITGKNKRTLIQLNSKCLLWSGISYNNSLYFIENKTKITTYNIESLERRVIFDLKGYIEESHTPIKLISVDGDSITLIATIDNLNNKKMINPLIYKIDISQKQVEKILHYKYSNCNLSIYKNIIYFSDMNGNISYYDGTKIKNFNIKGKFPSIAPDGKKVAYITTGNIFESLYIFEFKTKKSRKIISFFGPNTINPRLRWSNDSQFLAVHQRSDITPKPLHIIKVNEAKTVSKIKKVNAHNWFFYKN